VASPIAVEDIRMLARFSAPMLRAKQAGGALARWLVVVLGCVPARREGSSWYRGLHSQHLTKATPRVAREDGRRIAGESIFLLLLLPLLRRVLRSGVYIRVVQGESDDGPCTSTAVDGDANNRWELVEI
jgi:hypothetical protein